MAFAPWIVLRGKLLVHSKEIKQHPHLGGRRGSVAECKKLFANRGRSLGRASRTGAGTGAKDFGREGVSLGYGTARRQRLVQRGNVPARHPFAIDLDVKQSIPQKLDSRSARRARTRGREYDVEHCRVRLRGQRQRVERLIRHMRFGEDALREIEIRQRPVKHDRGRFAEIAAGRAVPHGARDIAQFVLAIAADHADFVRAFPAGRGYGPQNHGGRRRRTGLNARFLNSWELRLHALPKSGVVQRVGDDNLNRREGTQTAKEIEVRRPESTWIRWMVGNGNDDVVVRQRGLPSEQYAPEAVLVEGARRRDGALVGEEREAQEAGLVNETVAAAIGAALTPQLVEQ